jgi:hypothetical protein
VYRELLKLIPQERAELEKAGVMEELGLRMWALGIRRKN